MKDKQILQSLETRYKSFIEGKSEMPVVTAKVKFTMGDDNLIQATLTKEVIDRDGEIVMINGINVPQKGVPLLDSHRMNDNVTTNVLGRVVDIAKSNSDIPELKGRLTFANTPNGQIAKTLVEDGMVDSVSIGFGVKEYDTEKKIIVKSELYETSLVSVPANQEALIDNGKSLKEQEDLVKELDKKLNHYKEIKPAWDIVRKTFLSNEFSEKIKFEKQGNLLIDLNDIYDVICSKLNDTKETPKSIKEETPQKQTTNEISSKELDALINASIKKALGL